LRGDCGFGNEGVMRVAEARGLPYLFKLRLTKNVRRMTEKLSGREWVNAGQGFWAIGHDLQNLLDKDSTKQAGLARPPACPLRMDRASFDLFAPVAQKRDAQRRDNPIVFPYQ
jgi:hypothetical protein